jgi:hypothetical protein
MTDTYDIMKFPPKDAGYRPYVFKIGNAPFRRAEDDEEIVTVEDISFARKLVGEDDALMDWFEAVATPIDPYRFPKIIFRIGTTGFIIVFKQVLLKAEDRTLDGLSFTFEHDGYQIWLENPRSGACIWDDDTKILAMAFGVYTYLGTMKTKVIDDDDGV